jgi:hypothetical protein
MTLDDLFSSARQGIDTAMRGPGRVKPHEAQLDRTERCPPPPAAAPADQVLHCLPPVGRERRFAH